MRINRTFLALCRTIHVYLTMLGLFVMLMFGVTGFTVNHEDWFGATLPRVTVLSGQTPTALIEKSDSLHVVEYLRQTFHITGAMDAYDNMEDRLSVRFKSPGQHWEVEIEKESGKTRIQLESFNFFAVINNLHRGRDAGSAWSWVIDISALLIVLACVTGTVLWLALPKRRRLGIAALVVGTVATVAIFLVLVPGKEMK